MSSEYRDIVERFAEGLSPQEFALFEQMTEEQRKDVMSRAGVLRDSMAQGGIMNGRQGFYAGGGADMGSTDPGMAADRAAAGFGNPSGGLSDSAPGVGGGNGNGNGNGNGDGDPDGDPDGDEQEGTFFSGVRERISNLFSGENLVQCRTSSSFSWIWTCLQVV